jgi:peptide/nickel transport system substrate-binding protein
MKKFTVWGVIGLMLIIGLGSPVVGWCASAKTALSIGWGEGPQAGMNPFLARNEGDYVFLSLMYEPLVIPLVTGEIMPWLAKSWEYNTSASTWVFHLDERAKWSDGVPVTADDVKFTFEAAFEINAPTYAPSKDFIDSIQAVDEHTVQFKMKTAYAAFLPIAGGYFIMPKHIWSTVGKIAEYENPNPVGSGPFVFKQYQPRSHLLLAKNENYWKEPVVIDQVIVKIFSNPEAAIVALKKGDLDILPDISGNESLIPTLMNDSNVKVMVDRWPHILYLAPNYRKAPLDVKEVRKAIDIALDKQAIIRTALAGYAELPMMGGVPPLVTKWINPKVAWRGVDMTAEARLAEANAILDQLGFKKGEDGIRVTPEGKKLEFTLRCYTNPSYIRATQMIKDDLAKIGIKIEVLVSDPQTLYGDIVYSGKRTEDWDLLLHGTTMHFDPDHLAREYAPENPTPWDNATAFGWKNEQIQTLLQQSRKEMDEQKRGDMIQKVQELFADELPVISIGHRFHPAAYRTDKFTGWNPQPINYGGMFHPLGAITNLLSLRPKE